MAARDLHSGLDKYSKKPSTSSLYSQVGLNLTGLVLQQWFSNLILHQSPREGSVKHRLAGPPSAQLLILQGQAQQLTLTRSRAETLEPCPTSLESCPPQHIKGPT